MRASRVLYMWAHEHVCPAAAWEQHMDLVRTDGAWAHHEHYMEG